MDGQPKPVEFKVGAGSGSVTMRFEQPITVLSFTPAEARSLAMLLTQLAKDAEHGPSTATH